MCSSVKTVYKADFSELTGRLREKTSIKMECSLSLLCGCDNLCDERLAPNHDYWDKFMAFKVCLPLYAGQHRKIFFGWHIGEVFFIQPRRSGELFVVVWLWQIYHEAKRLNIFRLRRFSLLALAYTTSAPMTSAEIW